MKKTIFTLNIDNYCPNICEITYPLIKRYAKKIGADFHIINKRKFSKDFPVTFEKFQVYELSKQMGNDWNIFLDSDTVVHPEAIDWTNFLNKDTILFNGIDMGAVRWRYDNNFLRDGRNIGACTWNVTWSDMCQDLWKPLAENEARFAIENNIFPTVHEINTVITKDHLIDDYTLSRNIAKYGLKVNTVEDSHIGEGLKKKIKLPDANFYWHIYTETVEQKIVLMKKLIEDWKI